MELDVPTVWTPCSSHNETVLVSVPFPHWSATQGVGLLIFSPWSRLTDNEEIRDEGLKRAKQLVSLRKDWLSRGKAWTPVCLADDPSGSDDASMWGKDLIDVGEQMDKWTSSQAVHSGVNHWSDRHQAATECLSLSPFQGLWHSRALTWSTNDPRAVSWKAKPKRCVYEIRNAVIMYMTATGIVITFMTATIELWHKQLHFICLNFNMCIIYLFLY